MPLLHTLRSAARGALLALLGAGCATYGFARQDIGLRYDEESDTLELALVSQGLLETCGYSAKSVARDAGGARHVIVAGWPFELDLDELAGQMEDSEEPWKARLHALLAGIEVTESAAFGSAPGPYSLCQRLRIPRASEALALVDEALNSAALENGAAQRYAERFGARSGELLTEHARAKRAWVTFEGGALRVRIPMTPEGAARALEMALEYCAAEDQRDDLRPLLAALTELAVEDKALGLVFAPEESGWIRLRLTPKGEQEAKYLTPLTSMEVRPDPPEWVVGFLTAPARPARSVIVPEGR